MNDAVRVEDDDGVGRGVHDHAAHFVHLIELTLRFVYGLADRLVFAEVANDGDIAGRVGQRGRANGQVQGKQFTVFASALQVVSIQVER